MLGQHPEAGAVCRELWGLLIDGSVQSQGKMFALQCRELPVRSFSGSSLAPESHGGPSPPDRTWDR